jgi:hypothetical protein
MLFEILISDIISHQLAIFFRKVLIQNMCLAAIELFFLN